MQNLLEDALDVIGRQSFDFYKFKDYTKDSQSLRINAYNAPLSLKGSIQAVEQSLYDQLGLDREKQYRMVYSSQDMRGLDRQESPDMLRFEDRNWKVIRTVPWFTYNGWNAVLVCEDLENELSL